MSQIHVSDEVHAVDTVHAIQQIYLGPNELASDMIGCEIDIKRIESPDPIKMVCFSYCQFMNMP